MIPFWRAWFLTRRTFVVIFALTVPAIVSIWVSVLYEATVVALAALVCGIIFDTFWLWGKGRRITASRFMDARLSNNEHNRIDVRLESSYPSVVKATVVDELPIQLQVRDFHLVARIEPGEPRDVSYTMRPVERGVYKFGAINVLTAGPLGLVERRFRWEAERECVVYPSVMEMRRAELHTFSNRLQRYGMRKIRRLGHTMEFEKIKDYVSGDDIRSLNWKATARSSGLKVNLYQDERSQDVMAAIDLGRVMQAPFNGMTSLDYAVNAALAFSNVVLRKHDHAGLITYGSKTSSMVAPSGKPEQLTMINEALYGVQTQFDESNDEQLVLQTRVGLRQRSLVMLYTNIDALSTARRRLPYFRLVARRHVLVVVIFENVEVRALAATAAANTEDVYMRMVAREHLQQKRDIMIELRHYGIHCVVAPPEKLSVASIDRYLELKARGVV